MVYYLCCRKKFDLRKRKIIPTGRLIPIFLFLTALIRVRISLMKPFFFIYDTKSQQQLIHLLNSLLFQSFGSRGSLENVGSRPSPPSSRLATPKTSTTTAPEPSLDSSLSKIPAAASTPVPSGPRKMSSGPAISADEYMALQKKVSLGQVIMMYCKITWCFYSFLRMVGMKYIMVHKCMGFNTF